ncbi:MAG: alpha/beta hydrolase [Clostridia bacterium]|nr:alpha/beta hydrolase [Clostridia bacterium]
MRLTARGLEIYYEQTGTPGRPDVLCLHGWGCTVKHFAPIANELAKDYRVTVIDFPAHGQSQKPTEPWGVADFAACVKELMEKLRIVPCDIIAHSFGGRVAIYLAAHWPELVKRLVITGGAGLKKEQTPEQKKKSEAYQRKKKLLMGLSKVPGIGGAAEKGLEALRDKYGSADYKALDADMRQTFVRVISEDLRPLLPKIEASTLLIWGENDQDTPLWMGKTMEKEIPDAGLVVFENDDHFAYLRQWPRFVAVVRAFLT